MPSNVKEILSAHLDDGGGGLRATEHGSSTLLGLHLQLAATATDDFIFWVREPSDINKAGSGTTQRIDIWAKTGESQPAQDADGGVNNCYSPAYTAVWAGDQASGTDEPNLTSSSHVADAVNNPTSDPNGEVYLRREFTSVDAERFWIIGDESFWDVDPGEELFISSWAAAKGFGAHNPIFGKTDGGQNERNYLLRFVTTNSGILNFVYEDVNGDQRNVDGASTLTAKQIYHMAARVLFAHSGTSGDIRIYVDGSQDGVNTSWTQGPKVNSERPYIAYDEDASDHDRRLNGFIEIVRVKLFDRKTVAWVEAEFDLIRNDSSYISFESQAADPAGIASAEAIGSPSIGLQVRPQTVAGEEVVPSPVVTPGNVDIAFTGIESTEEIGTLKTTSQLYDIPGIPTAEVIGIADIGVGNFNIAPNSITTQEAFGDALLSVGQVSILVPSLPSEEAIGTQSVVQTIAPSGIVSKESVPGPSFLLGPTPVAPDGVTSAEAIGTTTQVSVGDVSVVPNGIEGEEAFGDVQTQGGNVDVSPTGIGGAEIVPSPTLAPGPVTLEPGGIQTGETLGDAAISTGNVDVTPKGIPTQQAIGDPSASVGGAGINVNGIPTAELLGDVTVSSGIVEIVVGSIETEESVSIPDVSPSFREITPSDISSLEAFGSPQIDQQIRNTSISTAEAFGTASVTTGGAVVTCEGIDSAETFGETVVRNVLVLLPIGISSTSFVTSPSLTKLTRSLLLQDFETDLEEQFFNTDEFAVTASYLYKDGNSQVLKGIFDNEFMMVDVEAGAEIQSAHPVFWIQSSDLKKAPDRGDELTIEGIIYKVITGEPDGTGVTMLQLHRKVTV